MGGEKSEKMEEVLFLCFIPIFQSVAKIRRELKFLSMCLRDSERDYE